MQVIRPVDLGPIAAPLVITGAASGIGRAVAVLAAAHGVPLALLDRDGRAVGALAQELANAHGTPAVGLGADVADEGAVDAAFAAAAERLGPPRGLVTSAGIDRGGAAHELRADDFDEVIAVNLRGTFLACRAALRHMREAGGGAVVCVSSPLGFVGVPGGAGAYSASKGGVSAFVRTLAVDYGADGIRVNALLPGATETPLMWASVAEADVPAMRAQVGREVPLGRLADPSEPARAALWLLSDQASYVTGAQIACDGGVLAKASISV
ncbi:MAG: SDR family oxidoreductase [Thermoleophilia bacterium]|nr:SDR family oxidoreductase [Thermoleophilia bacterium]